jgi:two-component system sensor histidine kinase KdpD
LRVKVEVPNAMPLLSVHAALIEQALVNVLENAARFSPVHGRIEVAAAVQQEFLVFSVSDEGPGIPEDERTKIFDMFYTAARGDRGGQGTGLGLAICQGMVGAHGGRVEVGLGIEGKGTSIALWLPLPVQPEAEPG